MIRKHFSNMNFFFYIIEPINPMQSADIYLLEMLVLTNLPTIKPTKQLFAKRVLWAQLIRVPVASFNTAVKRRFRPYINIL